MVIIVGIKERRHWYLLCLLLYKICRLNEFDATKNGAILFHGTIFRLVKLVKIKDFTQKNWHHYNFGLTMEYLLRLNFQIKKKIYYVTHYLPFRRAASINNASKANFCILNE